ncbi:MAG: anaerobic sulfatase maturase [Planctomycetes bacterium RBG_13_44_8b]|nr:MAG: anaerobic sulfatase maturase [Planctomycetes bacterium RBG_13_44_8b]
MQPFNLLIKPSGADCNLDCKYCFYKHKSQQKGREQQRMSERVLRRLVEDYMRLGFSPAVFIWQGGEPTLIGLDFYKKVVELQKNIGTDGQEVANCLQTNAILLNDEWCQFLHENKFLVGISLDGPREFHDYYRLDHAGLGTFDRVMKAVEKCKEHKVEFNALTLLNNRNVEHPEELFDFFVENDIEYLQFIPCIEINPASGRAEDFSITPQQYGEFLCRLFDRWYNHGPQNQRIRDFDSILSYCITREHTICTFGKRCSQYVVIEHTGDVFCCDFFVEPKWRLGNIFKSPIEKLAAGDKKQTFARDKLNLGDKCLLCRHLSVCRGGCVKDRILLDEHRVSSIKDRESYFCESYKRFFDYTMPRFMQIAAKLNAVTNKSAESELMCLK